MQSKPFNVGIVTYQTISKLLIENNTYEHAYAEAKNFKNSAF